MSIKSIFSFLVYPGKHLDPQPDIRGTVIPLNGRLYNMLSENYDNSKYECKIDIRFTSKNDVQENDVRSELINIIKYPQLQATKSLAERLQIVTTNKSGLGLLFIIIGQNDTSHSIHVSRFPAENGIIAEEDRGALKVDFIEKVFMKNALSYKAAYYENSSLTKGFWQGKAIDKQVSNTDVSISSYWINGFLQSDFVTTSAAGTRRLADAIKKAINQTSDLDIKDELIYAAKASSKIDGQVTSLADYCQKYNLSEKSINEVVKHLSSPNLQYDKFELSSEEFRKILRFRTVSINNGAILTAPMGEFESVFKKTMMDEAKKKVKYETMGNIINEQLNTGRK